MEIVLIPTTVSDFDDYYKIRCSPSDIYWNGYKSKPEKVKFREIFLGRLGDARFEETEDRRLYLIQLICKKMCKKIGFAQLIMRNDGIDIGYSVIEEFQRRGYATQALKLAVDIAKGFNRPIYVQIRDDNVASQGVAKKCGFSYTDEYIVCDYPVVGRIKLRKYRLLN